MHVLLALAAPHLVQPAFAYTSHVAGADVGVGRTAIAEVTCARAVLVLQLRVG